MGPRAEELEEAAGDELASHDVRRDLVAEGEPPSHEPLDAGERAGLVADVPERREREPREARELPVHGRVEVDQPLSVDAGQGPPEDGVDHAEEPAGHSHREPEGHGDGQGEGRLAEEGAHGEAQIAHGSSSSNPHADHPSSRQVEARPGPPGPPPRCAARRAFRGRTSAVRTRDAGARLYPVGGEAKLASPSRRWRRPRRPSPVLSPRPIDAEGSRMAPIVRLDRVSKDYHEGGRDPRRPPRGERRDSGGRDGGHPRAQRQRQEHAPEPRGGDRPPERGRDLRGRDLPGPPLRARAHALPARPHGLRLPVLQPDPHPDRARERAAARGARGRPSPRRRRARARLLLEVGLVRAGLRLPRPPLRRRAAAGGHRPRPRRGSPASSSRTSRPATSTTPPAAR